LQLIFDRKLFLRRLLRDHLRLGWSDFLFLLFQKLVHVALELFISHDILFGLLLLLPLQLLFIDVVNVAVVHSTLLERCQLRLKLILVYLRRLLTRRLCILFLLKVLSNQLIEFVFFALCDCRFSNAVPSIAFVPGCKVLLFLLKDLFFDLLFVLHLPAEEDAFVLYRIEF
jgi:hypothetical protein